MPADGLCRLLLLVHEPRNQRDDTCRSDISSGANRRRWDCAQAWRIFTPLLHEIDSVKPAPVRAVQTSDSGHQPLLPPANWCPTFASRTAHCEGALGTSLSYISLGVLCELTLSFDNMEESPCVVLQHDGSNHLGLRCNALRRQQMALITSDCGAMRFLGSKWP